MKKIHIDNFKTIPFHNIFIETPNNPLFFGAFVSVMDLGSKEGLYFTCLARNPNTKEWMEISSSMLFDDKFIDDLENTTVELIDNSNPFDKDNELYKKTTISDFNNDYYDLLKANLPIYRKILVNSLLYLASDEPEIVVKQKETIRTYDAKTKRTVKSDLVKHNVAVSYIKEIRRQFATIQGVTDGHYSSTDEHRHVRVHWRKGHYHTYLTGEGRKIPIIHWLKPQLIGLNKENDEETVLTKRTIA